MAKEKSIAVVVINGMVIDSGVKYPKGSVISIAENKLERLVNLGRVITKKDYEKKFLNQVEQVTVAKKETANAATPESDPDNKGNSGEGNANKETSEDGDPA